MTNEEQAISLQEKLEYFFVGLAFTILGLSVQTFDQSRLDAWRYLDIGGWALLFISGLSGLVRLESMYKHFKFHSQKDQMETIKTAIAKRRKLEAIQSIIGGGTDGSETTSLEALTSEEIEKAEKWIKRNEVTQTYSYWIAKWTFVGGLVALFISRGAPVIIK